MKKYQMSPQKRAKLDELLYIWNGKQSVRIIILGFLWMFFGPMLHKWTGIEWKEVNLVFAHYGPGGVSVFVGLAMYIVRTVSARWDGHIKK